MKEKYSARLLRGCEKFARTDSVSCAATENPDRKYRFGRIVEDAATSYCHIHESCPQIAYHSSRCRAQKSTGTCFSPLRSSLEDSGS